MSNEIPSHQDVETWLDEHPKGILDRLPDSEAKRVAKSHQEQMARLAHQCVESAECAERIAKATSGAQEAGVAWLGTVR
jgi:hypothetical protein